MIQTHKTFAQKIFCSYAVDIVTQKPFDLLNRIDAGFIAGWKRAWHYAQHIKNLLGLHGTHRHIDSQRTWLPGRCHKA